MSTWRVLRWNFALWEIPVVAFLALVGLVVVVACSNAPLPVAPEPGYPCGITGVVCVDGHLHPTGFCCASEEVCGGAWPNTGCPSGACCFTGSDGDGEHVGARANHPQTARTP